MNALNRGAPVGIGVWGRVDCVLVLTGSGTVRSKVIILYGQKVWEQFGRGPNPWMDCSFGAV